MSTPQHRTSSVAAGEALAAKRVAFTGKFLSMRAREARLFVRQAGGEPVAVVSRRTNMLVVGMGGWPLLPDGQVSLALRKAEEINTRGEFIRILSEEEFLEELGLKERRPALEKRYTSEEICSLTGIPHERLRRWEQLSLLRSSGGKYDFQDLVSLRTLTDLVSRGVRPDVIHRSLKGLAAILPRTDRPLAQLQVVLDNQDTLVAELDGCRIAAHGQLVLNFDEALIGGAVPFESPMADPIDAETWFERGKFLEEEDQLDEAADAYRRCIILQPGTPEAFFNLGNVLRTLDRPAASLEMLRLAVGLDPTLSEAWYNLADIQEEQGRLEEAIDCLKQAIAACPTFADAYYNLALCFEKLGRRQDARRNWSEYLKLDPVSEWASIARSHLTVVR